MTKVATKFDNKGRVFYKAIIDESKGYYAISGWPIKKKENRQYNPRVFYYKALDLNDLFSIMLTIAPFKKTRTVYKDIDVAIISKKQTPWIWKK